MSDYYVGEIRIWPTFRIPNDFFPCDGRALSISQYQMLYTLIGTTYGGDGRVTFNLPDLRGRLPIHQGQGTGLTQRPMASTGGETEVALTTADLPAHTHGFTASTQPATAQTPGPSLVLAAANPGANLAYYQQVGHQERLVLLSDAVINDPQYPVKAHPNIMPSFSVNFIIAYQGIFPTQN